MEKVAPTERMNEDQPITENPVDTAGPATRVDPTEQTLILHPENAVNTTKKIPNKTESDAEHEAATRLQAFWRMRAARTEYREKIRTVHKVTFVFALLIRLAVLAYLSIILFRVKKSMEFKYTNDPANADEIEDIVLQQLLSENNSGILNITFCRLVFTLLAVDIRTQEFKKET